MAPTLQRFVSDLWTDVQTPSILWQASTLALCLLLAWWVSRLLRARVAGRFEQATADGRVPGSAFAERSLELGRGSFDRLAFPLLALGFVLIGRLLLANFQHVNLLHVAVPLLSAMAAIRAVVYLLRKVFSVSAALKVGERWIALGIWLAVAAHAVGLTPDIIELLEGVGFHIGKQNFNLWLIGQAVFSIGVTLLVSLWLAAVIEGRLMAADSLDMSFRVVVGRFIKALVVVVAVMVSMALVGIDLTVLSVFGGALGVGLGLGLQRIASNYLSGFIILLDHSIRIGDLVTVDKFSGAVTQIATRYTVLKGLDGTESILPNEMLVNTPVLNHSYTNRKVALSIALAVAYDSDLDAVTEVMLEAAKGHERVLAEPPPKVSLARFGADGLELEMGFWIEDPERGSANVRSDLNFEIWRQFKAKGIEIPFPQREIRMVGAAQPLGGNMGNSPVPGGLSGGEATAPK
jgi:small-conductance mechanosensitive channel